MSDKSKIQDYVKELLKKNNFNAPNVYKLYPEVKEMYELVISNEDFNRYVRDIKKELLMDLTEESGIDSQVINLLNKYSYLFDSEDFSIEDFSDFLATKGELIHTKKKISKYKTELKKVHSKNHNNLEVLRTIQKVIDTVQPRDINYNFRSGESTETQQVMLLSDIHYGEFVDATQINGINMYNTDEAVSRIDYYFRESVRIGKEKGCKTINVAMLGDMLSGDIHDELKESNVKVSTVLLLELYEILFSLILELSNVYENVNVYCVSGNHGRLTDKIRYKNKGTDNYEYLLYKFLEKGLTNKVENVKVTVSDSPIMYNKIGNLMYKFEHGDGFKGGGNFLKLPLMSIARDSLSERNLMQNNTDLLPDVTVMGHFHVPAITYTVGDSPIILNPSIIGPNEFSYLKLHRGFPASQYNIFQGDNGLEDIRLIYL
jgi:predicted phosphodiesterase